MRRMFALLLALILMMAVLAVPAFATIGDGLGLGDSSGGGAGGNSGPAVGAGVGKEFGGNGETTEGTIDPTAESTEGASEETPEATDESTGETTETPTIPETEGTNPPAIETVFATEPQSSVESTSAPQPSEPAAVLEQLPKVETETTVNTSESMLLIALIAGLGAICVVLVIRRILDV